MLEQHHDQGNLIFSLAKILKIAFSTLNICSQLVISISSGFQKSLTFFTKIQVNKKCNELEVLQNDIKNLVTVC